MHYKTVNVTARTTKATINWNYPQRVRCVVTLSLPNHTDFVLCLAKAALPVTFEYRQRCGTDYWHFARFPTKGKY